MSIDNSIVKKISKLSKLKISSDSEDKMAEELNNILNWVESLQEVNTEEIEPLLSGIDQIPNLARQVKQHQYSRLRIITLNSLAHSLVPMALNKFCQKHPHANISITIKSRRELLHWERGEHFDVALASLPFEQRVFKKKSFISFPAVIAIATSNPLNKKKHIHINDLHNENLISLEPTGIFQTSIKKRLHDYNIEPVFKIQTTSMLQSAQMVENNIGTAIIDPFIGHMIKSRKVIIKKLTPQIYFDYAYIWPEGRKLSALAEEFIIELKKIANAITKIN